MAHILEFTIDGLAGRSEPLSVVLNRDINIFFGLNGSGKTTLLKILHSALSTEAETLMALPFARARVKIYLKRYQQSFVRTIQQPERFTLPEAKTPPTTPTLFGTSFHGSFGTTLLLGETPPAKPGSIVWRSEPEEPESGLTHYKEGFLPISRLYRNVTSTAGGKRLSDQELDSAFARALQSQWSEYYADISKEITKAQERGLANILGFFLAGPQEQE